MFYIGLALFWVLNLFISKFAAFSQLKVSRIWTFFKPIHFSNTRTNSMKLTHKLNQGHLINIFSVNYPFFSSYKQPCTYSEKCSNIIPNFQVGYKDRKRTPSMA